MAQGRQEVGALASLLSNYRTFITYEPLRTETDWQAVAALGQGARERRIPPRASLDPVREAWAARTFAGNEAAALFIPGRRFDASGARHGQGGGWYDRFLAEVPRQWLRIGFCFSDQLSPAPLRREPWDQAMDYVAAIDRQTGTLTLYSSEGVPDHG